MDIDSNAIISGSSAADVLHACEVSSINSSTGHGVMQHNFPVAAHTGLYEHIPRN